MDISNALVIKMTSIYVFLPIDAVDIGNPLDGGVWYIKLLNNQYFQKVAINKTGSLNIGQWLYLTIGK